MRYDPLQAHQTLTLQLSSQQIPSLDVELFPRGIWVRVSGSRECAVCAIHFEKVFSRANVTEFSEHVRLFKRSVIGNVYEGYIVDVGTSLLIKFEVTYRRDGSFGVSFSAQKIKHTFSPHTRVIQRDDTIVLVDDKRRTLAVVSWIEERPQMHTFAWRGKAYVTLLSDNTVMVVVPHVRSVYLLSPPNIRKVAITEISGKGWNVSEIEDGFLITTEKGAFLLRATTIDGMVMVKPLPARIPLRDGETSHPEETRVPSSG